MWSADGGERFGEAMASKPSEPMNFKSKNGLKDFWSVSW